MILEGPDGLVGAGQSLLLLLARHGLLPSEMSTSIARINPVKLDFWITFKASSEKYYSNWKTRQSGLTSSANRDLSLAPVSRSEGGGGPGVGH